MSKQPSPRADALRAQREQQAAAAEADAKAAARAKKKPAVKPKPCPWCKTVHDGACARMISGGQSD